MVNKILKNNNNLELKDKIIRMETKKKELKKLLNYNYKIESFKERTLKNKTDENILSEDVIFYAYDKCIDCQKLINLYDVSKDFENMQKEEKWIKCPSCGKNTLLHLNFQFGVELFNNEITELSSSKKLKVVLNSPKFLKDSIYKLSLKNEKFDVENFKELYETYFWNAIWYFKLVNIDINFMLPYLNNISINYNNIINEDKYVTLSTIESLKEYKKENKKLNIDNIFKSKNLIFDENELEIENIYFEIIPKIGLITLNSFLQLKNISITADVFYNNNDIYSFKANSNNNLFFSNFSKSSRKLSGEKIFNNDILQNSINSNLFFDKKYNSYNNENNIFFNSHNKINSFNEKKDEENIINNNNEEDNLFSSYLNDNNENNDDDPFKINNSQLNKLGTLKESFIENDLNNSESSSKEENENN
jgi:DNA-directed RNA polymerase subunit RPC12/RpoP